MCWEGIYKNFDDIKNNVKTLNNNKWVNKQIEKFLMFNKQLIVFKKENKELINLCKNLLKNRKKVRILDFGGSLGISYLALLSEFDSGYIDYHIIETEKIVQVGKDKFCKNKNINFYNKIPDILDVDILYIRTSLQYVDNWKETLNKLLKLRPENILLCHLSAGAIPTYLTTQIWNKMRIPYWFININELENMFNNKGYKIESKSDCENLFDCWNKCKYKFPKKYILNNTCNLILK